MWPFSRKSKEETFWNWVAANTDRLDRPVEELGLSVTELTAAVRKAAPGLMGELALSEEQVVNEIVISADGRKELFPAVQQLVAAAPSTLPWKVTAFRQPRMTTGMKIGMPGMELSSDEMWFSTKPDGELVALTVFIDALTEENRDMVCHAGFMLVDAAVGEVFLETRVGEISFEAAPSDPAVAGLAPFDAIGRHLGIL
ncbi:MAG: hypothetical protein ACJAYU_001399 [Bradymonadia bacterium]|jgi:hypothetical protein